MKKNNFQLTDRVKLLQKVVLRHQDSFLILQRSINEHSRLLKWDLPGGNSEWPEVTKNTFNLHRDDVAREIKEETGVEVDPSLFKVNNLKLFETFFNVKRQVFSVVVGWEVELAEDFDELSIVLSKEHLKYRWIKIDELDNFDFGETGQFIIRMIKGALLS